MGVVFIDGQKTSKMVTFEVKRLKMTRFIYKNDLLLH